MLRYKAPIQDMQFLLCDVFDYPAHYAHLAQKYGVDTVDDDTLQMILQSFAQFSEEVLLPLYQSGDSGCTFDEGVVRTPKGFVEAYQAYIDGGWQGISFPESMGGMGLPMSLNMLKSEMMGSANWAFAMYPGLSIGAINTILQYGTQAQKDSYLPDLVTGISAGTMCLTEANCGTDLGQVKTRATPMLSLNDMHDPDHQRYSITGSKIFISSGEHDLTKNIIHVVLARLPDAPKGTRGISLFIVPKLIDGKPNGVSCASIEHKMGIHASATCVLNFDGATGFLLGEVNKGLKAMFTFMNTARIGTGIEGLCHMELAWQNSLVYASERRSMRALGGVKEPDEVADAIIYHGDVRRMLLTQKALSEGARSMIYHLGRYADHLHACILANDSDGADYYDEKLAFFTPVIKGFLTELGIECANLGMQIFGGHGYVKEHGMEQIARDARIATLYEGTTGVQALDLLGRKVLSGRGKRVREYTAGIMRWCSEQAMDRHMRKFVWALTKLCAEYNTLTVRLMLIAKKEREMVSYAAHDYLMYSGYFMMAYHHARMAHTAMHHKDFDQPFYQNKVKTAEFYFDKLLPRANAHAQSMLAPIDNIALELMV